MNPVRTLQAPPQLQTTSKPYGSTSLLPLLEHYVVQEPTLPSGHQKMVSSLQQGKASEGNQLKSMQAQTTMVAMRWLHVFLIFLFHVLLGLCQINVADLFHLLNSFPHLSPMQLIDLFCSFQINLIRSMGTISCVNLSSLRCRPAVRRIISDDKCDTNLSGKGTHILLQPILKTSCSKIQE